MYTGTLIDELMTAVERTEEISSERERGERLAYWYAVSEAELAQFENILAGVA